MKPGKKILTLAFALTASSSGLLNVSFAQAMISPDGKTNTTVTSNGNTHAVNTTTVRGDVAFNSFNNFDVWEDHTANLNLPNGTAHLINIVRGEQSNINGVLNSFKDGKIGGNVFFLNPHGIVIGEKGVVNTGALTLATPTLEFIEQFVASDETASTAFAQAVLAGDMPINASGLISVKGKINTTKGVGIKAGKVEIARTGEVNATVDASDLVNVGEANSPVEIKNGKIIIKSETDITHKGKIASAGGEVRVKAKKDVNLNEGSTISSDALANSNNNGGHVVVMAGESALFESGAHISANGSGTGNGGLIVLNGEGTVSLMGGTFSAASSKGIAGSILVEPENIIIGGTNFDLSNGDYTLNAKDAIIIQDGVIIKAESSTGNSGNVDFTAKHIIIGDNVVIDAIAQDPDGISGNITFTAENVQSSTEYTYYDSVNASIIIGDNVTLKGNNIILKVTAENKIVIEDPDDPELLTGLIKDFEKSGMDDFSLTGVMIESGVSASLIIGSNVIIEALGDVSLTATATADTSISLELGDLSIGMGFNKVTSEILIGSGTAIKGENVEIAAKSDNKLKMAITAKAQEKEDNDSEDDDDDDEKYNMAFAYAEMYGNTRLDLAAGTVIEASKDVSLIAESKKTLDINATAESYKDEIAALAVVYSEDKTENSVTLNGSVTAGNNLSAISSIIAEETNITSETKVGEGFIDRATSKIKEAASGAIKKLLGQAKDKTKDDAEIVDLALAGAVALVFHDNNAVMNLGSDSRFTVTSDSNGDGNNNATFLTQIEDHKFQHNVKSTINASDDEKKNNAGALSVLVMDNKNSATLSASDGASFEVDGHLNFKSSYEVVIRDPELLKIKDMLLEAVDTMDSEAFSALLEQLQESFDTRNDFFATWVQSSLETKPEDEDANVSIGVGGAVSITDYSTTVKTELGAVNINQKARQDADGSAGSPGKAGNSNRSVSVEAVADTFFINVAGNFSTTVFGNKSQQGIGASYLQAGYTTNVQAGIADAANIYVNKGFGVEARTDQFNMNFSAAFGKATSFGLDGAFNWLTVNNTTLAYVGDATIIIAGEEEGDSSPLISAIDNTNVINATGGVTKSRNIGVGASVSLTDVSRNTQAWLGQSLNSPNRTASGLFSTDRGLEINAANTGYLHAHSLAAAIASGQDKKEEGKDAKGDGGKYGIGVSGNVSITTLEGGSAAYINNAIYTGSGDLSVTSREDTAVYTVAGALSFAKQDDVSVGLAGAVSINESSLTTQAFIRNSNITLQDGGDIALSAKNSGNILAVAAGGSGAVSKKAAVGVAGSVTINEIGNSTLAYIDGSTLTLASGKISATARDESEITSIAGAVSLAFGNKAAVGIGSSTAVNTISNRVSAYGINSFIYSSGLTLDAYNDSDIFTVSGTLGVTSGQGLAAAVSVSVNEISNETSAFLDNTFVRTSNGDITIQARGTSQIFAIAGQGSISISGQAIGAAAAVNTIKNTTSAFVGNGSDLALEEGSLVIDALTGNEIKTSSAGLSIATGDVAVAGSVSVNNIDTNTYAGIENSKVAAGHSVHVTAESENKINFYGGTVSASKTVGAGGTANINNLSNNATALITNSTVDIKGAGNSSADFHRGLLVDSRVKDAIEIWSFNASGSGTVAVAANTTVSEIANSSIASIQGSTINENLDGTYDSRQEIKVNSSNEAAVAVQAGSLAGSGTVAAGAVADVTVVRNTTVASIEDSLVRSPGNIAVSTNSLASYDAILAAGAASGTVGVAGSVGVIDFQGSNSAFIKNSTVDSRGDLLVEALDTATIGDDYVALGALGVGIQGTGIGGSVWVSQIKNKTSAYISDSIADASGNLSLKASGDYSITSYLAAVGGGTVGIGASVGANTVMTETQAYIEATRADATRINDNTGGAAQNVLIEAESSTVIKTVIAGAGGGLVGVGASVNVNTIDNFVQAGIKGPSSVKSAGDLSITASNSRRVEDIVASVGVGGVAVNGSISVNNIGGNIDDESYASIAEGDNSSLALANEELGRRTEIDAGTLGHGDLFDNSNTDMSRFVYNLDDLVDQNSSRNQSTSVYIDSGAIVDVGNDLNMQATDTVQFDIVAGGASGSATASVGATVAVVNLHTVTSASIASGANVTAGGNINVHSYSNVADSSILATIGAVSGGLSASGVVATVNSVNDNYAFIGDGVVVQGGNVSVKAVSLADIKSWTIGVSGGQVGIGASVSIVNKGGTTSAWLGDNVALIARSLELGTESDTTIEVEAEAAAGGVVSGNAAVATANITESQRARIGENNRITVGDTLNAYTRVSTVADVKTIGASLGAVTAGASVAVGNIALDNRVEVGDNTSIEAATIILNANQDLAKINADSMGVAGGGVLAVGAQSNAGISGTVQTSVGNKVDLSASRGIGVTSQSNIVEYARADRYSGGGVSIGWNGAYADSHVNTRTILGQGLAITSPVLELNAKAKAEILAETVSGSGGAVDVAAVVAETTNRSNTDIIVGNNHYSQGESVITVNSFKVNAQNDIRMDSRVDGLQAGAITASGFNARNTSNQDMQILLTGNTHISAQHVDIQAVNKFTKDHFDKSIDYLGIAAVSVPVAMSTTTLSANTNVVFDDGLDFTVTKDSEGNSNMTVKSYNDIVIKDLVKLDGGSVVGSPVLHSTVNTTTHAGISVGNALIKTYGDLDFNVKTDIDISSKVNMSVYGVAAVVNGRAIVNSNADNRITLGSGADVFALGHAYFNIGAPQNDARARISVEALTQIWNNTAVPMCTGSTAEGLVNVNNAIDIQADGRLRSAQNLYLKNTDAVTSARGTFDYVSLLGGIASSNKTGNAKVTQYSTVNVDGDALAGVNNIQNIFIDEYGNISFSNEDGEVDYEFRTESLANTLNAEIKRLEELRRQYAADAVLAGSYDRQIESLYDEMRELGLVKTIIDDDGLTKDVIMDVSQVEYIILRDLYANKGDIYITANDVTGSGNLAAEGYAELTITNNSSKFLRIEGAEIRDDAQGIIFYNSAVVRGADDIGKINSTVKETGFNSIRSGEDTRESRLIIRNNYLGYNEETGSTEGSTLELLGNIYNRDGSIDIFSEGNIYTSGNILGSSIRIESTKDIRQTYYEGFYHTGGDPSKLWESIAQANEDSVDKDSDTSKSATSDDTPGASGQSSIIAQNIYISGRYLNLNGLIQAGTADLTLNIYDDNLKLVNPNSTTGNTFSIAEALSQYNEMILRGETGASHLYALSNEYGNVSAFYNLLTNEIEVGNITAGGGTVEIYGHILNTDTNGSGSIVALDGYSRLDITNESQFNMVINSIDLSEANGIIRITDTAKTDQTGNFLETIYTRSFQNGESYVKVVNSDIRDENGKAINVVSETLGTTSTYDPLEGQRYVWMTGQEATEKEIYYREENSFWGMSFLVPDYSKYDRRTELVDPRSLNEGELLLTGQGSDPAYIFGYEKHSFDRELTSDRWWESSSGWWVFSVKRAHHEAIYETGVKYYYTHSIKADNQINIGFIGYETGSANIFSSNNITLNNVISVSSGSLDMTSGGGSILNAGNGHISANDINLNAHTGIGGDLAISIDLKNDGVLTAVTQTGDINIDSRYSDIRFDKVETGHGDVNLNSTGSIVAASPSSVIKADRLFMGAQGGNIGSADRFVNMQVNEVSARTSGNVYLQQDSGDLGVNSIVAGDYVEVNVTNGSVYDANTNEESDPRTEAQLLADWDDMDLFGEAGWTRDQLTYAVNANKFGENTGTNTNIEEANITAGEVKVTASGSIGMDNGEITLDLTDYSQLTQEEKLLLASAEADALSFVMGEDENGNEIAVSVTIKLMEDFDIHSDSITLNANGYIYLGGETDININTITAGDGQNITIKGAGGIYNVSTSDGPNITGNDLVLEGAQGGIGTEDRALVLDLTGKLDARALENIYLESRGDLNLSYVYSGGQVSIKTSGDILNALNNETNIRGYGIDLQAANIGTENKSLNIQLEQDTESEDPENPPVNVLNIAVTGDAYLRNQDNGKLNHLYVGDVSVDGHLKLVSDHSILQGDENSSISAATALLESLTGSLGALDARLETRIGELAAAAEKDINLYLALTSDTALKEVTSRTGSIDIEGSRIIEVIEGLVAAKDITLLADIIELYGKVVAGENIGITGGDVTATEEITAGKNLDIKGDTVETGALAATDGNVNIKATEAFTGNGSIKAGEDIDMEGTNSVELNGALAAGNNIGITGGDITATEEITAGKNLDIKGDTVETAALAAIDGSVNIKAFEAFTGNGSITAGEDIDIEGTDSVDLNGALVAGNNIGITGGDVTAAAEITAGKNLDIKGDTVETAALAAIDGSINIKATEAFTGNGSITAGEGIDIEGTDSVDLNGALVAGNNIGITGGDVTAAAEITAGKNLDIKGDTVETAALAAIDGSINIKATEAFTGNGSITAGEDIDMEGTNSVELNGTLAAGNNIGITGGDVTTTEEITAGKNLDIKGDTVETAALAAVDGSVNIKASEAFTGNGSITAGEDIDMEGTNSVELNGTLVAGNNIDITGGDITATEEITAGKNLDIKGDTVETASLAAIDGSMDINATRTFTGNGSITAGGTAYINADRLNLHDQLTAGGDITLYGRESAIDRSVTSLSGSIFIDSSEMLRMAGNVSAGRTVTIKGRDIVSLGDILAVNDVTITGNTLDSLNIASTLNDVTIQLSDSLLSRGTISSGGKAVLKGANTITLEGEISSGNTVDIETMALAVNASINALRDIGVAVRDVVTKEGTAIASQNGSIIMFAQSGMHFHGELIAGDAVALSGEVVESTAGISAVNNVTITAGTLEANAITSKAKDVMVDVRGDVTLNGVILSGRDFYVNSGGVLVANGTITAGNDIVLSNHALTINDKAEARGYITISVDEDIVLNADMASLEKDASIVKSGRVLLNGVLSANRGGVTITARESIYDTFGDDKASITANDINLYAARIGEADNYLSVNTAMTGEGYLSAGAEFDLYITSPGKGLNIKQLEVTKGDINIIGKTSLEFYKMNGADFNLKANNISLHATEGRIGSPDARVSTALNTATGLVNLMAADGIYLRQTTPSFYSDYVYNTNSGMIDLLLTDNNIQIKDIMGLKGYSYITPLGIYAVNKDSQVTIAYHNVQKLVVDPVASRVRVFNVAQEEAEEWGIARDEGLLDYEEGKIFNFDIIR